jgi:hypothetical protein
MVELLLLMVVLYKASQLQKLVQKMLKIST